MSTVKRTEEQLLEACEDHLLFLKEAYERHLKEHYRYRQMAAELRVLVAGTTTNKPLLLDLVDQYSATDSNCAECCDVTPYRDDGLGLRPLIRVDQVDAYMVLWDRIVKAKNSGDDKEYALAIREKESLCRTVPLREFIEKCACGALEDGFWDWRRMILEVSQQMGSAHEDWSIGSPLDRAQNFTVGGPHPLTEMPAHVSFLGEVSEVVLICGKKFIDTLASDQVMAARHDLAPSKLFYGTAPG